MKLTDGGQFVLPTPVARTLYLVGEIEGGVTTGLIKQIHSINESDELLSKLYSVFSIEYKPQPINLNIETYGGDVYAAMGLVSVMLMSKTPITAMILGSAMSAGFFIAMAASHRLAHEHSTLMYHQVSSSVEGTLDQLKASNEEVARLQQRIENFVCSRCKLTPEKLARLLRTTPDWYITAQEAIKYGIIHQIIE